MDSTLDSEFSMRVLIYIQLLPSNILWLVMLSSQEFEDQDVISAFVETNTANRRNQSQKNTHSPTQNQE